jgi:hypothetical protein
MRVLPGRVEKSIELLLSPKRMGTDGKASPALASGAAALVAVGASEESERAGDARSEA